MYALQTTDTLFQYSPLLGLYPIIFGSIFVLFHRFTLFMELLDRQTVLPEGITRDQFTYDEQPRQNNDNTEIVVASGRHNITEVTI